MKTTLLSISKPSFASGYHVWLFMPAEKTLPQGWEQGGEECLPIKKGNSGKHVNSLSTVSEQHLHSHFFTVITFL